MFSYPNLVLCCVIFRCCPEQVPVLDPLSNTSVGPLAGPVFDPCPTGSSQRGRPGPLKVPALPCPTGPGLVVLKLLWFEMLSSSSVLVAWRVLQPQGFRSRKQSRSLSFFRRFATVSISRHTHGLRTTHSSPATISVLSSTLSCSCSQVFADQIAMHQPQ